MEFSETVYVDVYVDDIVQEMSPSEKKEMIEALQSDLGDMKESSVLSQETVGEFLFKNSDVVNLSRIMCDMFGVNYHTKKEDLLKLIDEQMSKDKRP